MVDISWEKILHPSEKISTGELIKVKVIKYDNKTQRVSLGLKQLVENPWNNINKKYCIGKKYVCKITKILEYGIFLELEKHVEGLVYTNEIDWKNNIKVNNI